MARHDPLRGKPGLSMIGFLVVEMIIGYEWFVSGLVKLVRGGFPAGLAGELALVLRLGRMVFPVVEVLGEGARGEPTVVNVLGGLKVRLREWLHLGLAVQLPVTKAKEFSSQGAFGPDVEWKW
jgi:hypothetical protein